MTKDEELAMDLALEALEYIHEGANNQGPHTGISWRCVAVKAEPAIKAIKQARALDKMAENARELGLDYEPVTTLFGSLPVYDTPPVQEDWGPGPHECHSLTSASVQEPVAWRYRGIFHEFDPSDWAEGPVTPLYTTPPAQPAPVQEPVNRYCCHACFTASGSILLDRMILCPQCGNKRCPKASDHRLDCTSSNDPGQPGSLYTTPPAQPAPVQEPVWIRPDELQKAQKAPFLCRVGPNKRDDFVPLYPAPPAAQRQWVEVEQIKWEGDKLIAKLKENT